MILVYNLILFIAIVLCLPVLIPVILTTEKRKKTILHRLGIKYKISDANNSVAEKPIWVHALSVGEVLSAIPLLEKLNSACGKQRILFSASTHTGFETAQKKVEPLCQSVFYFPYDFLFSIDRVVQKVDPKLVILIESDIWPNFLYKMKRKNIPVILVNARLSDRSFKGYLKIASIFKYIYQMLTLICVQSQQDFNRYAALGIAEDKIKGTGNIKYDQAYDRIDPVLFEKVKQKIHLMPSDKAIVAGSTHAGEEDLILETFIKLKTNMPDLRLIIAPRNPQRAESILIQARQTGFGSQLYTRYSPLQAQSAPDILIVDIIGVLVPLYAFCDVAFIGGSLVRQGGHNPLEPAAFGKPIVFGTDMSDFKDVSERLLQQQGALQVKDQQTLYKKLNLLLNNIDLSAKTGNAAFETFEANKGAIEKVYQILGPYI